MRVAFLTALRHPADSPMTSLPALDRSIAEGGTGPRAAARSGSKRAAGVHAVGATPASAP